MPLRKGVVNAYKKLQHYKLSQENSRFSLAMASCTPLLTGSNVVHACTYSKIEQQYLLRNIPTHLRKKEREKVSLKLNYGGCINYKKCVYYSMQLHTYRVNHVKQVEKITISFSSNLENLPTRLTISNLPWRKPFLMEETCVFEGFACLKFLLSQLKFTSQIPRFSLPRLASYAQLHRTELCRNKNHLKFRKQKLVACIISW